jgi:predicted PurR-regulated permease PerM
MIIIEWNIISVIKTLLTIIMPLFIGWFIAWLLHPFVKKLMKKGISKGFSVTIVYTILIIFILLSGWFILASLGNQMSELISSIPKIGNQITGWIDNIFVKISNLSLHNLDGMKLAFMDKIEGYVFGLQTNLPDIVMKIVTTIFSGLGQIALSFLLAFYISYDFDKVSNAFKGIFPKKARNEVEYLLDKLNESLYAFVSGTLWLSILLFVVSVIGFSIIGLNASIVISFICVITNLIPYIGPYMGAAIAGVLGFVQGPIVGILTLVFIFFVQMIEGNVLHPIVMSKKLNLSPITIIISLLIFEYFFGIIGMIIATPVVAIMKIIYVFLDEKYNLFGFMDDED